MKTPRTAGDRICAVCNGAGTVEYMIDWLAHRRDCPCCRGAGIVSFEKRHQSARTIPGAGPRRGRGAHAPTWAFAITASSYGEYVMASRAAGEMPVYRELYELWRRRAVVRGLIVAGRD